MTATNCATPNRTPTSKPWLAALSPAALANQLAFKEARVKHRKMDLLLEDLLPLLTPHSESNITVVTGATDYAT